MNRFIIIILTGSFFISSLANAQGRDSIKARIDKNKILIGEPFQLIVEARYAPGPAIRSLRIDSISHFEWLDKPLIDSTVANGYVTIRGTYRLTSFDSGHWVIPSFSLTTRIKTDTIPIDVVFSEFDPEQDYHDIKDIIAVEAQRENQWWWWVAGGGLLLLALVVYLLKRKKRPVPPGPAITIDPFEEAIRQLDHLRETKLEVKTWYSKLSSIFRLYVSRRKGIHSMQKTTDDLVLQLKSLNLDKELFDRLSQSLRLSDFVKFAKYVPSEEDNKLALENVRNSIMTIEKSEVKVLPPGGIT